MKCTEVPGVWVSGTTVSQVPYSLSLTILVCCALVVVPDIILSMHMYVTL